MDPTAAPPTWLVLLQTLSPLIIPPLLAILGNWLLQKYSQLPTKQQEVVQTVARIAVEAAEQLGKTAYIKDKKQYALWVATNRLNALGVKVDEAALEAAIEAQVLGVNQWVHDLPAPAPAPAPVVPPTPAPAPTPEPAPTIVTATG